MAFWCRTVISKVPCSDQTHHLKNNISFPHLDRSHRWRNLSVGVTSYLRVYLYGYFRWTP